MTCLALSFKTMERTVAEKSEENLLRVLTREGAMNYLKAYSLAGVAVKKGKNACSASSLLFNRFVLSDRKTALLSVGNKLTLAR